MSATLEWCLQCGHPSLPSLRTSAPLWAGSRRRSRTRWSAVTATARCRATRPCSLSRCIWSKASSGPAWPRSAAAREPRCVSGHRRYSEPESAAHRRAPTDSWRARGPRDPAGRARAPDLAAGESTVWRPTNSPNVHRTFLLKLCASCLRLVAPAEWPNVQRQQPPGQKCGFRMT